VIFIALFYFFVPFFFLLMRPVKKRRRVLAAVAVCVLIAHVVAMWWTIAPSVHTEQFYIGWIAFIALFGIGGIWSAAFIWNLEKRQLVPLNDPRFAFAIPA
jgi:peptidoglycan/LPS O-acetylase OafA/YrhL